jgi:hypothetical protein
LGGGQLAQLRRECNLSEVQLGEIDPTSETIKLATLGLRGVAANILWEKANRYKMNKEWTNLSAALNQITKVEPHFIAVWRFQAWNLSYNVSSEFDDYRKRYEWVIEGINFLEKGTRYNEHDPRLIWDVGWFTSQKIGLADEHKQFRRLFKQDDDFHGSRPPEQRDNWLVGKESFARAERLVARGAELKGMSPAVFYSDRPMCQMNYSETLADDGIFGEKAERSWNRADREWTSGPLPQTDQIPYGARELPTARGEVIRLNDRESTAQEARQLRAQLDAIQPGLREKIAEERRLQLTGPEREALNTPYEERTEAQHRLVYQAESKLRVTNEDVANRLSGAQRSRALELAKRATQKEAHENLIARYREIVNFEYWRRRAKVEQTSLAVEARQSIYEGDQAFADANLNLAIQKYQDGFRGWREVLDSNPGLVEDREFGRQWVEIIQRYKRILEAAERTFPDNFILQDVLDLHGQWIEETEGPETPAAPPEA